MNCKKSSYRAEVTERGISLNDCPSSIGTGYVESFIGKREFMNYGRTSVNSYSAKDVLFTVHKNKQQIRQIMLSIYHGIRFNDFFIELE